MSAYYNENDAFAGQWLRNLIAAGHIAPGDVDERSIRDVHPADLIGYDQYHFFAGIGVWSSALRQAGWPDNRPVWTGSCPCQPFSAAGQRKGISDDRHLWPDFYRLIVAHYPITMFGEQVASRDGLAWLDIVYADLEAAGYAVGALDTCAAGFGAPHIRQRLYFVADSASYRTRNHESERERRAAAIVEPQRETRELADAAESRPERARQHDGGSPSLPARSTERGKPSVMANTQDSYGRAGTCGSKTGTRPNGSWRLGPSGGCVAGDMGDTEGKRRIRRQDDIDGGRRQYPLRQAGATNGFWRDAEWLPCIDGKARAVEPGTFPLAHGAANRVGRLRGYGNSLVAPQAEAFIRAYMEARDPRRRA